MREWTVGMMILAIWEVGNLLVRRSTMRLWGVMKKTLDEVYREWRWWEGKSAEVSGMGLGWKWWRSWDLKKGWWGGEDEEGAMRRSVEEEEEGGDESGEGEARGENDEAAAVLRIVEEFSYDVLVELDHFGRERSRRVEGDQNQVFERVFQGHELTGEFRTRSSYATVWRLTSLTQPFFIILVFFII